MKARPDLTPNHTVVLSNPNDFYVDSKGRVNEIEDDEERILFGTVANPKPSEECFWVDWAPQADSIQNDAERRFYAECEEDVKRASDPATNPHLMAVETVFKALGLEDTGLQRPKDASNLPAVEEEEDV